MDRVSFNDLRSERDRLAELAAAIDRALDEQAESATAAVVVTFQASTYPVAAQSVFACAVQVVGGPETEGAAGTLTLTSATIYAYNLGAAVPPPGTALLAVQVGDRWTFRYDG